jgi:uncharacterized membrane protein
MKALIVSSILLLILDGIFLGVRQKAFLHQIRVVQNEPLHLYWGAVLACYTLLILGLNYFIIFPRRPVWDAFFLGCLVNGVFETTNYSIFKKWELETVVVDTLWGGVLFATTTYLTYLYLDLM